MNPQKKYTSAIGQGGELGHVLTIDKVFPFLFLISNNSEVTF